MAPARNRYEINQEDEPSADREQSSRVSGADRIVRIVLPLSTAIIAVLSLMYAVGHWNSYFSALIFLSDAAKYPLQIVLRNILILNAFDPASIATRGIDTRKMVELQGLSDLLKHALIVVASLPVLMLYPFVQKYFVKGVLIGSLKG